MSGILSRTSFTIRTNSDHSGAFTISVTSKNGSPFASSIVILSSSTSSSTNSSTDGSSTVSSSFKNSSTDGNSLSVKSSSDGSFSDMVLVINILWDSSPLKFIYLLALLHFLEALQVLQLNLQTVHY